MNIEELTLFDELKLNYIMLWDNMLEIVEVKNRWILFDN